ncbi:MAG: hypothetical protein K0V04_19510 [Deltaproteobacteria bacterium]|nr:hypothetical protein [Deltaproteobacteria bacterium]
MRIRLPLLAALLLPGCDGGGDSSTGGGDDDATTGGQGTDGTSTAGTMQTSAGTADSGSNDATAGETTQGETTSGETTRGDSSGGGSETGAVCEPLGALDPRRSLIETRPSVLSDFGLSEVFAAVATNAGLHPDPLGTHDRLFDTYRHSQQGEFNGHHCDDELIGQQPSLNGFPLLCPRSEGAFAAFDQALDGWFATAFVNRIDLAPADGSHCGEQRIIFANPMMVGRAFIILEAQIPNPSPGCGVAACGPITQFWADLDAIDDPAERTARLRAAFIDGDPTLSGAGFGPFMSADNLTFGTGQVRTNNFVTGPWTLREYKFVPLDAGGNMVVSPEPVPVSASVHDTLWNDTLGGQDAASCRSAMLDALPGLLGNDVATMGWSLPQSCRSSESVEFEDFYDVHLSEGSGNFAAAINAEIAAVAPGSGLDAFDVARRAQFAGSCIGCHEHANFLELGGGVTAPSSLSFVHVEEQITEPCGDGSECFAISPALIDVFLPSRMQALETVHQTACDQGCAMASVPTPGHALPAPGLDEATLHAIERVAAPTGLTVSGRPVGGH